MSGAANARAPPIMASRRRQKARALAASVLCVVPLGFRTGLDAASLAAEHGGPPGGTEIVLCRHGETDWNVQGRLQGLSDIPLNGVGRSQALEIAAAVKAGGASVVVASPLLRARDTAAIVADECGADLRIDARLREASLGVMEGRTAEEINATHPEVWAAWLASEPLPRQARAEPCEAVAARLEEAILEAAAAFPAGRVVVVTHGAAIKCLLKRSVGNASITVLRRTCGRGRLHTDGSQRCIVR